VLSLRAVALLIKAGCHPADSGRDQLAVTLERMQHWNGGANTQAGLRWTFHNGDSVDLIAGRSEALMHDRWLTAGLNLAL